MRTHRRLLALLGTLPLACLPTPAIAQPVGSEFQINTYTTGWQLTGFFGSQRVAADASGNFVVIWYGDGSGDDCNGIFGQRYDSTGGSLGIEFRVNSFTFSDQRYPSVAAAADGHFAVVWSSWAQDGSNYGIFGQRYDSAGVALGDEFRVNSYSRSDQHLPSVASDADGNFVVVWTSYGQDGCDYGIFGQRYDSGGALGKQVPSQHLLDGVPGGSLRGIRRKRQLRRGLGHQRHELRWKCLFPAGRYMNPPGALCPNGRRQSYDVLVSSVRPFTLR